MKFKTRIAWVGLAAFSLWILVLWIWFFSLPSVDPAAEIPDSAEAIERGAYLFTAGGCISCHRDEANPEVASGGLGIETPFGTFYAPNITPDPETGIGGWQAEDILLAMKHGRAPDRSFYYPAFPYRSYAGLSDEDVLDLAAYLLSLEPVRRETPDHDIQPWLRRFMLAAWNRMADIAEPQHELFSDPLIARGAYLARHLAHCGECHTPRNPLGIPEWDLEYAGADLGEDHVEAIDAAALEHWTVNNFDLFLLLGLKPDTEFVGGDMNEVIEYNTSRLTDEDRDALAAYFKRHDTEE